MTDDTESNLATAPTRKTGDFGRLLWLLLPFAVLGLAVLWLFQADPLQNFRNGAPPVEQLTIERTLLNSAGLSLLVRAGGSEDMKIAQPIGSSLRTLPVRFRAEMPPGSSFPSHGSWVKRTTSPS
jgi:hypothetical protein